MAGGAGPGAAGRDELAEPPFDPAPRPKQITLKLVMQNSLPKEEADAYDQLSMEEVLARAQSLTTLHLEWQTIGEIANLECFDAAEVVYLQYNRIPRIEGLEGMPRLQFLALQHNRIRVIENLLCLTALEFLDLSKNKIATLDVAELPTSICILNLKENPCTDDSGYLTRLLARLPDLGHLDGVDVGNQANVDLSSTATCVNAASELTVSAGEKGLSAYYKRGALQSDAESGIADQIAAYATESLADVDGLSERRDVAVGRSVARQKQLQEQVAALRKAMESQLLPEDDGDCTSVVADAVTQPPLPSMAAGDDC